MRNAKATSAIASPTCSTKVVASFLLGTLAIPVAAANFSFTGTFADRNQLQPFEFSIAGTRVVSINTLSSLGDPTQQEMKFLMADLTP